MSGLLAAPMYTLAPGAEKEMMDRETELVVMKERCEAMSQSGVGLPPVTGFMVLYHEGAMCAGKRNCH